MASGGAVDRTRTLLVAVSAAVVVGGCSNGGKATSGPAAGAGSAPASSASSASSASPTAAAYRPRIEPAQFSARVTNRYFPLKPGTTLAYDGTRDGKPQHGEMVVTAETRMIMGVPCVVVRDTVTSNGALVEQTTDWYAQSAAGDVWYFGEDTKEYTNGVVSSTKGSWEAGVDGAQPGIIMKGAPKVGAGYRQEYRPGEAEDMAKVLRFDSSIKVPAGTYRLILVTEDSDPLNPDKLDRKYFAPGVGLVYTERAGTGHREELSLVKKTQS